MLDNEKVNIAYIDAANLDKSLKKTLQWKLDYKRFRIWLKDKYQVEKAYIFIGMIPKYADLYLYLQECGFELVFKEVLYYNGEPKGNIDSDLLAKAFFDMYEGNLNKAVLVASDGDYAPLVKALNDKECFKTILSPAKSDKLSILLKRVNVPIAYIDDQRSLLESKSYKQK